MVENGTGWEVAKWLWGRRDEVLDRLRVIRDWVFPSPGAPEAPVDQPPGILVLGSSGAGKSTLRKLLAGEHDLLLDSPWLYDESRTVEKSALRDDPTVEVVVPPGEKADREWAWDPLLEQVARGQYRGIVLITAYRYHTFANSYRQHKLYRGNKEEFLAEFLKSRREDELAALRRLAPHIRSNDRKTWLLTLVTKQDLWWHGREEVETHYREGGYGAEVESLLKTHGQRRFRHEFAFASLVISNFETKARERLRPNTEGYDFHAHVESLRRVFETFDALRRWAEDQ